MMKAPFAFVHTSPVLVPVFTQLAEEYLPGVACFHMADESLIKNTIAAGRLTPTTARRVLTLIESAQQAGAGAVLVTCSSIGEAVAASRPFIEIPVFRIDEAMAEAAVERGARIGVAATLRTTLEPTLALLQATAAQRGRKVETIACLCDGAFESMLAGDVARHDALVIDALSRLVQDVDVAVLAQASMARVLPSIHAGQTPVLTSPRLAMERIAAKVAAE
jgi:Asp/Glu/hydantoin racemase